MKAATPAEAVRRDTWRRLQDERTAARAELVATLGRLDDRARDPFGLKERFRKHPVLFAGLAAGAGALLVRLVAGAGSGGSEPRTKADAHAPRDEPSPVFDALRDAALRVATPWLTRLVAEHLGQEIDLGEHADPADRAAPPN